MPASAKIIELKKLLAEKYAESLRSATSLVSSGIALVDETLQGGFVKGAATELIAPPPSSGASLLLCAFFQKLLASGTWLALVDGCDCFDAELFSHDQDF